MSIFIFKGFVGFFPNKPDNFSQKGSDVLKFFPFGLGNFLRFARKKPGKTSPSLRAVQTWVVPVAPRASSPVAFALGAPHRSGGERVWEVIGSPGPLGKEWEFKVQEIRP